MQLKKYAQAAIVTTAASEETQQIHDRMPVILEKPDFPRWLASEPLAKQEAERLSLRHLHASCATSQVAESIACAMTTRA